MMLKIMINIRHYNLIGETNIMTMKKIIGLLLIIIPIAYAINMHTMLGGISGFIQGIGIILIAI